MLNYVPEQDSDDETEDIQKNEWVEWVSRYTSKEQDPTEPMVRILYPILDTAADESAVTVDTKKSNAVGVVATSFLFKSFFDNILTDKHHGLVMVFSNACNQTFTYQVDGKEAVYIGAGDLHDKKYES